MNELTQTRLKELVHYNRKTGAMVWVNPTSMRAKKGSRVGNYDGRSYLQTQIDGRRYRIHRLIWLWIYGVWPKNHIDHIDRDRSNNKLNNLRDVTQLQNNQNISRSSANTSGYVGVSWSKIKRSWEARISVENKSKVIGYFEEITEAAFAYQIAKQIYHPTATL